MRTALVALLLVSLVACTQPAGTRAVEAPRTVASVQSAPRAATCASSEGPGIPPPALASVPKGIPGLHAYWYGQSGYPTLCPGARSRATVAFYNSGSQGWVAGRMGEVAYLGTWEPEPGQDRPSVLGGDGQRGSPNTGWPRYDRVAVQPAPYVGPGQVAWFQFEVQAPTLPGSYRLAIRPLIEGATWLEDYGVFWHVTVLAEDGTPPRVAGPDGTMRAAFDSLDLRGGTFDGTRQGARGIELATGTSGTWTSDLIVPGFAFTEMIPSWNAETQSGTSIRIALQTTPDGARLSRWWEMAIWAHPDDTIARRSVTGQSDADGRVVVDTWFAAATAMRGYRVRLTLQRSSATAASPVVLLAGAVASDAPLARPRIPSTFSGVVRDLAVPSLSQEVHAGEYPQFDGGGEAWCSPTSTSMVLGYWGVGPSEAELSQIPYADPQVDHAARYTYDSSYRGTGNWPFNTAYAATFGLRAFVTQLRSLREAEAFIAAGIPLVASISVGPNALPGFLFGQGSDGHLLVIRGFTQSGDVISNDPAARSNAEVRRVYPRAAFERSWLEGSFGTVYVIHPASTPLPPRPAGLAANW